MQDLSFETFVAVLEEMVGHKQFWFLVITSGLITLSFIYVLLRDRRIVPRRLLWAEVMAPVGAALAVGFIFWSTRSGFDDIGGAIDVILVLIIAVLGAIGFAFLTYTFLSYFNYRKTRRRQAK